MELNYATATEDKWYIQTQLIIVPTMYEEINPYLVDVNEGSQLKGFKSGLYDS